MSAEAWMQALDDRLVNIERQMNVNGRNRRARCEDRRTSRGHTHRDNLHERVREVNMLRGQKPGQCYEKTRREQ